ncbi:kinase [Bacillus velezensis]|uniref:hypothetical protein n=1 Tax=Bacillus TaxID=1386 RepID=UPI00076BB791|nr:MULTISPECIES: hypothetical protein [Bacillus amyloliquefaciens group]ASP26500.1 kinase [Bacillus velezensis]ATO11280.1 kinase [Bacillus velezensis]AZI47192.1 kinase [Bacillus velezensis]MEB3695547.1 kinase [Bacillus amyloliquefaciens]MED4702292.1 kinase [Bacillus velezensis]
MHITLQSICPVLMIAFFLYKKVKRSVGFQPLKPRWLYTRMILFSLLAAALAFFSITHPALYGHLIFGTFCGWLLVLFAKRNISFEERRGKMYFRTHLWIELILLTLFLSRFIYRVIEIYRVTADFTHPEAYSQTVGADPLTISIFYFIAVYYSGFSFYVLKTSRDQTNNSQYG